MAQQLNPQQQVALEEYTQAMHDISATEKAAGASTQIKLTPDFNNFARWSSDNRAALSNSALWERHVEPQRNGALMVAPGLLQNNGDAVQHQRDVNRFTRGRKCAMMLLSKSMADALWCAYSQLIEHPDGTAGDPAVLYAELKRKATEGGATTIKLLRKQVEEFQNSGWATAMALHPASPLSAFDHYAQVYITVDNKAKMADRAFPVDEMLGAFLDAPPPHPKLDIMAAVLRAKHAQVPVTLTQAVTELKLELQRAMSSGAWVPFAAADETKEQVNNTRGRGGRRGGGRQPHHDQQHQRTGAKRPGPLQPLQSQRE